MEKFTHKRNQTVIGRLFIILGMFGVTMLLACTNSGSKKMKNKEDTTTVTKNSQTYQELGFFGKIKEDKWEDLISAVRNNVAHSRQEPGNLAFYLYESEDEKQKAFWFERFEAKKDHDFHKEQDYFENAIHVIQESLETDAISIYLKEINGIPAQKALESKSQVPTRHIFVLFDVKSDKRKEFLQAMQDVASLTRKAKGNLEFNLYEYTDEANKFALIEGWQSKQDHLAHLESEYSKKLEKSLANLFVSNPMNTRWLAKDISNYP